MAVPFLTSRHHLATIMSGDAIEATRIVYNFLEKVRHVLTGKN